MLQIAQTRTKMHQYNYLLAFTAVCHKHPVCRLLAGQSGVIPIERFDASEFPTKFAAQIKDFSSEGCAPALHSRATCYGAQPSVLHRVTPLRSP